MRTEKELINQVYAAEKIAKEYNVVVVFRFFDNYTRPIKTVSGAVSKIRKLSRFMRPDFIISYKGKNGRYYDRAGAAVRYGSVQSSERKSLCYMYF